MKSILGMIVLMICSIASLVGIKMLELSAMITAILIILAGLLAIFILALITPNPQE